jgi:hypothetical protein
VSKEAFCLVMWRDNGGLLDSEGDPTGPPVKSLCEAPEDCATCEIMLRQLDVRPPGVNYLWVCPCCTDLALAISKQLDIDTQLPGYYTSGLCQRVECPWGGKFSNFLQLLLVVGEEIP